MDCNNEAWRQGIWDVLLLQVCGWKLFTVERGEGGFDASDEMEDAEEGTSEGTSFKLALNAE